MAEKKSRRRSSFASGAAAASNFGFFFVFLAEWLLLFSWLMAPSYFQQNNRRRPLKGERDRTRKLPPPPRTRIELKEERKSLIGKKCDPSLGKSGSEGSVL